MPVDDVAAACPVEIQRHFDTCLAGLAPNLGGPRRHRRVYDLGHAVTGR